MLCEPDWGLLVSILAHYCREYTVNPSGAQDRHGRRNRDRNWGFASRAESGEILSTACGDMKPGWHTRRWGWRWKWVGGRVELTPRVRVHVCSPSLSPLGGAGDGASRFSRTGWGRYFQRQHGGSTLVACNTTTSDGYDGGCPLYTGAPRAPDPEPRLASPRLGARSPSIMAAGGLPEAAVEFRLSLRSSRRGNRLSPLVSPEIRV